MEKEGVTCLTTVIACSIAFFSTAAFIALWFGVVRKELTAKQNMVESAKAQLIASRTQLLRARDAPEMQKAQEILDRSLDIYRQSLELYNDTLQKPRNAVLAFFLGFRPVAEGDKR